MLVQDVGCSIVQYFINELNLTGWLMLLNKILCPLPKNLQAISNVQFVFMYKSTFIFDCRDCLKRLI